MGRIFSARFVPVQPLRLWFSVGRQVDTEANMLYNA